MSSQSNSEGYIAPIFVTGMPRSGTTFVQHLLSSHSRICIHGQEPARAAWGEWLITLLQGIDSAKDSNAELNYAQPHYAGAKASAAKTKQDFLRTIFEYMTGGEISPRWGLKSLTNCRMVADEILEYYPEARWIVCIRDPFRSFASLRNTFDTSEQIPLSKMIEWWTDAAEFAATRAEALPVQIDRLHAIQLRTDCTNRILEFVGESLDASVSRFIEKWPVIHEVCEKQDRLFAYDDCDFEEALSTNAKFRHWCESYGYISTNGQRQTVSNRNPLGTGAPVG